MNLSEHHKQALSQAARAPDHPEYTKINSNLERVIERIKAERPEAFLTFHDMQARCFVHKPPYHAGQEPTPYARALRERLSPFEVAERQARRQMA
jgi:hypothetical protein